MHWHHAAGSLDLTEPVYLGILNLTPDSFSDGGRFLVPRLALDHARDLKQGGAAMLDVGAESTRPGASPLSAEEEWQRLNPVLDALGSDTLPLSLDSRHPETAARALAHGITVINDVTGFRDPRMVALAQNSHCGLIAMRSSMVGDSFVMPPYEGPGQGLDALLAELRVLRDRLLSSGISSDRILLDPGFGFGTTFRDDQALWEALPRLPEWLDWPAERFCLGLSRKRFVAWLAGQPELPPEKRDEVTRSVHTEARGAGFRVFRTHALPPPEIRAAQLQDCPALARVQVAAWRAAYREILPGSFLAALDDEQECINFRARWGQAGGTWSEVQVLERGGRVQGFAALGLPAPDRPREIELSALYLHPSAWHQGLGHVLLNHVIAGLRTQGFGKISLWVLERNARARRFYEREGWRPSGSGRTEWQGGIALREVGYHLTI